MFDLNLNEKFTDFDEIDSIGCEGFCVTISATDIAGLRDPKPLPPCGKPLYTRINIAYSNRLDSATVARLRTYNIVCIVADSLTSLHTIAKLAPDMIQVPLDAIRHAKKTLAGTLREHKLFIELSIRDALGERRVAWMNACRKLLRLGCKRSLVISSGATVFTELRGGTEVARVLRLFGLRERTAQGVVGNAERLLRLAALRRYSTNGAIANSVERGAFKRDFIIEYHRKRVLEKEFDK